jgi:hypothetical protein
MNVTSNNYSPGFCYTHIFTKSDRNENKISEQVNFMSVYLAWVIIKSTHPVPLSQFRGFVIFWLLKVQCYEIFYFSFVS